MTSMLHARSFSPVLFQKIRVSTELYGVMCNIYYPISMETGFMNYSDIVYGELEENKKLLIPKAVIVRNNNGMNGMQFDPEEDLFLWTTSRFPKYSKIITTDNKDLLSFIITDIELSEDTRSTNLYFKYRLLYSASVPNSELPQVAEIISDQNILINNPVLNSSITDVNKVSTIPKNNLIKRNEL